MNLPIPKNVGSIDRLGRVVGGTALAVGPVVAGVAWPVGVAVGVFGASIAVSGLLGRCSVYHLLGVSTAGEGD
ncbi:MAG: DUF2892 domain-containing protein [Alphaproteobacteria bacterium]|nr:DUF2892 domain-containing protein [Alphaproteobacteria bacterium]